MSVEYIESGTFVGGEETAFDLGIEVGEVCVVMKKSVHKELREAAAELKKFGSTPEQREHNRRVLDALP